MIILLSIEFVLLGNNKDSKEKQRDSRFKESRALSSFEFHTREDFVNSSLIFWEIVFFFNFERSVLKVV